MKFKIVSNTHRKEAFDILAHFRVASNFVIEYDYLLLLMDDFVENYYDFTSLDHSKPLNDQLVRVRDYPDSEFYEMSYSDYLHLDT